MDDRHPDTSYLDNCRFFFVGEDIKTSNYITRAIIEFSGDISPAMPHLSRSIENCGYSPRAKSLAFRFQNMPVVVRQNTITINGMRDRQTAQEFLDWLKRKIKEII